MPIGRLFEKIKGLFTKKKEDESTDDSLDYGIEIEDNGSNENTFNEVVNMFCTEIKNKFGLKINPKEFIIKTKIRDGPSRRFVFHIPTGLSDESGLLFDIVKKNVQLKIKNDKKYKEIELRGFKKIKIDSSDIPRIWQIIDEDIQLKEHKPLFLNLQVRFYTSIFDYARFVNFVKNLDKFLNMERLDYNDVERRIKDAVDEVISDMHTKIIQKTKITKKETKETLLQLAKQGAIKLIFMRNYTWDTDDLKNKTLLNKLSNLFDFMQKTLKSDNQYQDFLISIFELSTNLEIVSACGCFATINDKTGIDESILLLEFPDKMKEV